MGNYVSLEIAPQALQAWLFDDRENSYALRGTLSQPWDGAKNLKEAALELLAAIRPGEQDVQAGALTVSAGAPIRTLIIGIAEEYSLAALRELAGLFQTQIIGEISLQDGRSPIDHLETLLSSDVQLILLAGGTDSGARFALLNAIDLLRVMRRAQNRSVPPQIVCLGNAAIKAELEDAFCTDPNFHLGGNILPVLDHFDFAAALPVCLNAWRRLREVELPGLKELQFVLEAQAIPSLLAEKRLTKLVYSLNPARNDLLYLRMEKEALSLVSIRADKELSLTFPWSCGENSPQFGEAFNLLPLDKNANLIYYLNKQAHPGFTSVTLEDQAIEQSLFRADLRSVSRKMESLGISLEKAAYEPIIVAGDRLDIFGNDQQMLMALLDGLQPFGVTTFVLDQNGAMTALGALAPLNPSLVIEAMHNHPLRKLSTVVSLKSPVKAGKPVLEVQTKHKFGAVLESHQVLKSELRYFDLETKDDLQIELKPSPETDLGFAAPGVGASLHSVSKGSGLIVDGRGRPLPLPGDMRSRVTVMRNWLTELGG